ncbi:MAG: YaeQ family protein [Cellvibrionaceae bacterium]|nr:YaeQ family protein [Cellvibrionaceae bacterium]
MALKPTIHKCQIQLSDMDRHIYEQYNLTLAQHPSETVERLCARLMAFCFDTHEDLQFAGGLCVDDEPELWQKSPSGEIEHWVEVGQPELDRVKKLSRRAVRMSVYSFGKPAPTWWQINGDKLAALDKVSVYNFDWGQMQALAQAFSDDSSLSVSISDQVAFISTHAAQIELARAHWCPL